MTIFMDPYHTPIGMVNDVRKTSRLLLESTIRDSLVGTNLGVRSENDVTPVFITGCRDSERDIPLFTHPISVKNSNGSSYLFADMRQFIRNGADLHQLDKFIRRYEEFEITKYRAIASLAWVAGDRSRFEMAMRFGALVFSSWMGQAIGRAEAMAYPDQLKVQVIAMAYYMGLFHQGAVDYRENDGLRMVISQYFSSEYRMSSQDVNAFVKTLDPMPTFADMCRQISKSVQSALLRDLDARTVLNLVASSWFATNSREILAVATEHPPTWCSILYFCMAYNNFQKTVLGQTIQAVGRNGKAQAFKQAYEAMISEYSSPTANMKSVMESMGIEDTSTAAPTDLSNAAVVATTENHTGGTVVSQQEGVAIQPDTGNEFPELPQVV